MPHSTPTSPTPNLETCEALSVWIGPLTHVIVWRDGPKHLRPAEKGKRIRDLKPGDKAFWKKKAVTVERVEVWR